MRKLYLKIDGGLDYFGEWNESFELYILDHGKKKYVCGDFDIFIPSFIKKLKGWEDLGNNNYRLKFPKNFYKKK